MAQFLTPAQIEVQYFQFLKSIKPSLNTNDKNSDFVIRGKAFSGLVSGLYGDQAKVDNDTYTSSARLEALIFKGADYGIPQQPATQADSPQVRVPGTNGTVVTPGELTFLYLPTGILYTNTTGGTVSSGILDVAILADVTGQIGNIAAPDSLTIVSPPSGIGAIASIIQNVADGSDIESTDSYRARLLSREQNPPAGGNITDYPAFAFAADPSVRTVDIVRFGRGLGTVDVYITSGTTDVDTAVTNGLSVVRIPSGTVIDNVQDYLDAHVPLTDCAEVFPPIEQAVAVTIYVALAAGYTLSTVPSDPINNPLNLTVNQLIIREVGRALYKLPVGGRIIPGNASGVVPAADIESGIDMWLSSERDTVTGLVLGKLPIIADRQCGLLSPPHYDLLVAGNVLAAPGVITVIVGIP